MYNLSSVFPQKKRAWCVAFTITNRSQFVAKTSGSTCSEERPCSNTMQGYFSKEQTPPVFQLYESYKAHLSADQFIANICRTAKKPSTNSKGVHSGNWKLSWQAIKDTTLRGRSSQDDKKLNVMSTQEKRCAGHLAYMAHESELSGVGRRTSDRLSFVPWTQNRNSSRNVLKRLSGASLFQHVIQRTWVRQLRLTPYI